MSDCICECEEGIVSVDVGRFSVCVVCVWVCVCVQEKTGLFCVAFVRVEDASFVRSLLFRYIAVQESLLTWVASVWVCVCETRKYDSS